MKAVRLSRSLILAIALVVSLGANVALFVGGVVYNVVDEFVDRAFGLTTVAATQSRALTALKTASAKQDRALAASRAVVARQSQELADLRMKNGAIGPATKRSRDRLAKSIRRSILTAPGKAFPTPASPSSPVSLCWRSGTFARPSGIRTKSRRQPARR